MKQYLFILLGFFIWNSALSQTRTSIFKLPQWSTGDTLKAGTANDSAQSNFGLNNGFYRLEAILGRQMDSSGLFRFLYGRGTGNLTIDAGVGTATPQRIVLNDSLYGTHNWQTTANALIGGNVTVGGYASMDSIQTSGNMWIQNGLEVGDDAVFYDTVSISRGPYIGIAGVEKGYINFFSGLSLGSIRLTTPDISIGGSTKSLYIPSVTDGKTIGTIDGNQNFSDMGQVVADSVQSDNNYTVLYSDTKIAGAVAGDTSANFTTFLNTTNGVETKVRMAYLHRRGTANIKAYYQQRGTDVTGVFLSIRIYTLAGSLVTSAATQSTGGAVTYEDEVCTLDVKALNSNQTYELRIVTYGSGATDLAETKALTVIATSN